MSFSAFNVGRQVMTLTSNKAPQLRLGSKPVAGGSFTPTTLEAAFVMRSSLDYQWEKAFNDKYKAMMQNRLNDLQKKLQEAYADILNVSMSQQIGQDADRSLRADVRLDGMDSSAGATLLEGVAGENGFEDLGIVPNTASRADSKNEVAINYTNPAGNSGNNIWRAPGMLQDQLDNQDFADDGVAGYGRTIGSNEVQFRTLLERTTAAGNVAGDLHVTMRVEDDPAPPTQANVSLDALNSVTSAILGGPADPYYGNQKVSQFSTSYKTGGFWSTVNYLYNFAPREIKYSYAVGYTVNSDEAGNDEYLIDGEIVSLRDQPDPANPNSQAYLEKDKRIKWQSFDPTEGYQHERSGTAANYPTVINREKAWISGQDISGGDGTVRQNWYNTASAASGTTQIVENLIFQSGTYTYNGSFINEYGHGDNVAGTTNMGGGLIVQTQANSASGLVNLSQSNIEMGSVFRQRVDLSDTTNPNQDNTTAAGVGSDFKVNARGAIRSSLFFNHYEVETRTVEFNNANRKDVVELTGGVTTATTADDGIGKVYAYGGIERSKSVDASKNYDLTDTDLNPATNNSEITRSAGNVNGSFNGEFVQSLHKIHSVNGVNIVGNETKQASPVIGNFEIGRYEGLLRSEQMTRNVVDYKPPSDMEINASNAVPTDWYQAELLTSSSGNPSDPTQGSIWFPQVDNTLYSGADVGYGAIGSPRQLIQARNTFTLTKDEFMQLEPAANWVVDATGVRRPTYAKKDYFIDLDLTGIHHNTAPTPDEVPRFFINGREIPINTVGGDVISSDVTETVVGNPVNKNMSVRINLKDYLQEGHNVITIQASDAQYNVGLGMNNFNEGIRLTAANSDATGSSGGTNLADVDAVINSKIATGYNNAAAVKYNSELQRENTIKAQSRWQTRIVPLSTEWDAPATLAKLASDPAATGTSYKVANSFIELIIDMINKAKYRDIFKLGLMSNLNKIAIQGQANLPNGATMQGAVTLYYDQQTQSIVLYQDKLIANS